MPSLLYSRTNHGLFEIFWKKGHAGRYSDTLWAILLGEGVNRLKRPYKAKKINHKLTQITPKTLSKRYY